jgi:hypothetical protein
MRASLTAVALVALLFSGGCNQISSPTPPTSVSSVSSVPLTSGDVPKFGTTALFDSVLDGSAYRLDGVSGTLLTFSNNQQSSLSVAFDSNTKFRRAVLQSWVPSDPYYQAALAYNTVATSDGGTLAALVGGNVRIVLVPPNPIIPNDPYHIQSFQPIP